MTRVDSLSIKLERAKHHVRDVYQRILAFSEKRPYEISAKDDANTGHKVYYVSKVAAVPVEIRLIAGEAIHALRSTLDHLAYRLIEAGSGFRDDNHRKRAYFPIAKDANGYESEATRKIDGVTANVANAMRDIEPFKGGKGHDIWVLDRLDNIDKHRFLIMAAGRYVGFNPQAIVNDIVKAMTPNVTAPDLGIFLHSSGPLKELEENDELLVGHSGEKTHPDLQFGFEIAFFEPQVLEGESVTVFLAQALDRVSDFVSIFRPFC